MKVRRQGADLLNFIGSADEEIRGLVVKTSQSANNITDVSAYAELSHPPDVDGDLHRSDLNTDQRWKIDRITARPKTEHSEGTGGLEWNPPRLNV